MFKEELKTVKTIAKKYSDRGLYFVEVKKWLEPGPNDPEPPSRLSFKKSGMTREAQQHFSNQINNVKITDPPPGIRAAENPTYEIIRKPNSRADE